MANRWAQLGSAFGGGISAGLLQAFLKQAEEEQRKAEVAQQYQDMAALSRALGIPIPQYQPQSEAGLNIMQQMVQQQAVPESYTLGPGQRRYQGQKVVAEAPPEEEYEIVEYWDRSGKKRQKRVPASQFNETVERVLESGGSLQPPSAANPKWGEPFKVGNQWLQRDPETGRIHTLFKEDIEKAEYTPGKALKEIEDIHEAKATLEQTNELTALIASANPYLAPYANRKIDPRLKEELYNAWDKRLQYLYQFVPPEYIPERAPEWVKSVRKPIPKPGETPEYEYVPGQGLKRIR